MCARASDADRTRHFSQYVYFNQIFSSAPFPFRASRLQACDRTHPSVAAAYMAVALAFGSSERSKMVNSIVVHTNITYTNTSCLHTHTHTEEHNNKHRARDVPSHKLAGLYFTQPLERWPRHYSLASPPASTHNCKLPPAAATVAAITASNALAIHNIPYAHMAVDGVRHRAVAYIFAKPFRGMASAMRARVSPHKHFNISHEHASVCVCVQSARRTHFEWVCGVCTRPHFAPLPPQTRSIRPFCVNQSKCLETMRRAAR